MALFAGGGGENDDPQLSMRPGLCLHPILDAGRVLRFPLTPALSRKGRGDEIYQRILVSAQSVKLSLFSKPMSLYRAEEVGPSPPLGVAMLVLSKQRRVHRMSPVFTLLLRAEATIVLIEPASASPTSMVLHA